MDLVCWGIGKENKSVELLEYDYIGAIDSYCKVGVRHDFRQDFLVTHDLAAIRVPPILASAVGAMEITQDLGGEERYMVGGGGGGRGRRGWTLILHCTAHKHAGDVRTRRRMFGSCERASEKTDMV